MTQSPHTSRRARWLAGLTGVHVPYLDLLPASETVRYANAAIAMLVSVASAGAGWAMVGSWSTGDLPPIPRSLLSVGAGLAAGVVVWSLDRDLISGDGNLAIRGTVGAVNALFVGEIVLLALFAPFVETQLNRDLDDSLDRALSAAEADYNTAIASIEATEAAAQPPVPDSLVADRQSVDDALRALHDAEQRLDDLNELRTAEVTGRVIVDGDGQPLTSGRAGDRGLATESLDRQIGDAQAVVDRAVAQLDAARANVAQGEAAYTNALGTTQSQTSRFNDDRLAAQTRRDQAIAAAQEARIAPVGLLDRLRVFHYAVWGDALLRWIVLAVHLSVFAAELSVVLWALTDRRRPIRLYRDLVHHLDQATTDALADIAAALVTDITRRATNRTGSTIAVASGPAVSAPLPTDESGLEPVHSPEPTGTAPVTPTPATTSHSPTAPGSTPVVDQVGPPPVTVTPTTVDAQQRLDEILQPRPVEISTLRATPIVEGGTESLRPKHIAVLAYLALHPSTGLAALRHVFWPDSASHSASANTLSTIRKILGHTKDGRPRLAAGRSPTLSSDVASDWARFVHLSGDPMPETATENDRLAFLVAAVNLVDGPPGTQADGSPANWEWLLDDSPSGTRKHLTAAIHATTDQLISLSRRTGHPELIDWATTKARLVGDYDPPPEPNTGDQVQPRPPAEARPLVKF